MKFQEHVPLRRYTTFRVGGPARYFVVARNPNEMVEALRWARDKAVRYFIMGGGSNCIFSDEGYDGLIIKPELSDLEVSGETVSSGASVMLSDIINVTLKAGLIGMEFAAGIPGTLGGAIRGNAGTFGVSVADVIQNVDIIDEKTFDLKQLSRADCDFSYRHSMFKQHAHVIVRAKLVLRTGDTAASLKLITERIKLRREQHPTEPSAGCIFKNVEFGNAPIEQLLARGLDIERYRTFAKIPSGYLIEALGLKGKKIGGAQVSPRHANYIINTGTATAEDVITLISYIKQQVRDAYGIQLEEEVHLMI